MALRLCTNVVRQLSQTTASLSCNSKMFTTLQRQNGAAPHSFGKFSLVDVFRRTYSAAAPPASSPDTKEETKEASKADDLSSKSDREILDMLNDGQLQPHHLEPRLKGDLKRAVFLRRKLFEKTLPRSVTAFKKLPYENYDYEPVMGQCCENVVGYIPVPVGIAGPLKLDGELVYIPLATTEGALVASTQRGCKAITVSGGATTTLTSNGMTRAPLVRFPTAARANQLRQWLENSENFYQLASAFNSTSRFARLKYIKANIAGRNLYLRFKSSTGDAMGMNMVTKGVEKALEVMALNFPDMQIISLSGNFCTDKKPAAINWVEGRGKSVVAEAIIPGNVVTKVLHTTVDELVDLNINKNLIGSAMAGVLGGFNAHASNIVSAVFIATGQDVAQNVESSHCITIMERTNDGKDLYISCTMPSIEVGTIGGGTHLAAQSSCLEMLDAKGSNIDLPGKNAEKIARVVCGAVLSGELSLMSALAAGHLVKSHLKHNRKTPVVEAQTDQHRLPIPDSHLE